MAKRPSKNQMDERITLDLPADKAIEAILKTGPHTGDDDNAAQAAKPKKPRRRAKN